MHSLDLIWEIGRCNVRCIHFTCFVCVFVLVDRHMCWDSPFDTDHCVPSVNNNLKIVFSFNFLFFIFNLNRWFNMNINHFVGICRKQYFCSSEHLFVGVCKWYSISGKQLYTCDLILLKWSTSITFALHTYTDVSIWHSLNGFYYNKSPYISCFKL